MQDKKEEKGFYDQMYTRHTDGHFISHGYEHIYSKTVATIPPGLVLDVGCGTGKHSVHLARLGFRTVAIDLSFKGILHAKERARQEGTAVYFVVGDVENLPFKTESFDAVFCALVLHHFPDLSQLSRELARVVKRYLFALETNGLEPMTFMKFNVINPIVHPRCMTPNQRALFPKRIQRMFSNAGFSRFEFSWIDIHVPYGGIVAWLTKAYMLVTSFLPARHRTNKFVMACAKLKDPTYARKSE